MKKIKFDRSRLATERRNRLSSRIDRLSTLDVVGLISAEDKKVAPAVARERRQIAAAVDIIADAFRRGGRLFYVGAGTSGRLGVLDASECPPTFGVPRTMVQGVIAGGRKALVRSIEGAEDRASDGAAALRKKKLGSRDMVCGIAACGITPFVRGAVEYAKKAGARTIFITCAPEAKKLIAADIVIAPAVGPEVVTGSTRMKAGTATKLILNMLTTATMVKTGKVYGNLMVDLRAVSEKLRDRAERIVMAATGFERKCSKKLLARAGGRAKTAIAMHLLKAGRREAEAALDGAGGFIHKLRGSKK